MTGRNGLPPCRGLCAAFAAAVAIAAAAGMTGFAQATSLIAIQCGRLIDGTGASPRSNAVLIVAEGRIREVTSQTPVGARVIDLSRYTVLPGLIDAHTHITIRPGSTLAEQAIRESVSLRALYGLRHAQKLLDTGFTTIRDLGNEGAPWADVAVRDAIVRGLFPGPRMLVATQAIAMTGSHDDIKGYSPEVPLPGLSDIADGPDEIRRVVRRQIKYGADVIKVYMSGGIDTPGDAPEMQEYSYDEVRVAVEEAARHGRRVAAHADSPPIIREAIRAGVASIEHGSQIDAETAAAMAKAGVFLVTTPMVLDVIADDPTAPAWAVERSRRVRRVWSDNFPKVIRTGVKIVHGTEAGGYFFGTSARQLGILTDAGLPAMEAIKAATSNAAALLGLEKDIGTLEAGKAADVIAVDGDPLQNIRVLEKVEFVMKEGAIHRLPATMGDGASR